MSNDITIKISLEAHQELILRKLDTDVPVIKQIDRLLGVNQREKRNEQLLLKSRDSKSNGKR